MLYSFDFTIPANTLKAAPATLDLPLSPGSIAQVSIAFPPGPNNEVKIAIFEGVHQLFPTDLDSAYSWDDYTMTFPENYELRQMPFALQARGWSPGTNYSHTVTIRLSVLPGAGQTLSQRLLSLLGRE